MVIFAALDQSHQASATLTESTTDHASNAVSPVTFVSTAQLYVPPGSSNNEDSHPSQESPKEDPQYRNWEYSTGSTDMSALPGVKGKLKPCLSYWKNDLKASDFVLDLINYGYKIPFAIVPPPFCAKNNKSSLDHPDFVESAISDLLVKQCVIEQKTRPYCCNPLTVSESKKLRLVLDLRHPNQFITKFKFKYEDLPHIAQVLGKDQYYFSFDLESGYHHVDIFQQHQKYLGFAWTHRDGVTRYYTFTVLPFGLNSACYLFTKLTRPLVYSWRARGILSFIYIDDGLIISPSLHVSLANLAIVQNTIARSGFVASKTKCIWQPSQSIQYLGFIIDSVTERFYVPEKKVSKLLVSITNLLTSVSTDSQVPVRALASCAGQLISMTLAVGPISSLLTRAMYRTIESRLFWSDNVFLSDPVVNELQFWAANISSLNGFPIKLRLAPTMQIFSDASDTGYGGFVQGDPKLRFHGIWTAAESRASSTWRELAAVYRILSDFGPSLRNQKVKWSSDNANVPRIIRRGSVKPHLQELALGIFNLCRNFNIIIIPEWLPRCENKVADKISRFLDFDDWSIDDFSFNIIDNLWGPHTVDRFASPHNNKLTVFNARFWCRGVSGVDAFCQDWHADNNYLCPPVSLIVEAIKRMQSCAAIGTLIVPKWTTAYFWPFICPDGSHLNTHVHDWRLMRISFSPPSLGTSTVFCKHPNFLCLALRLDFQSPSRQSNRGFCCSELGHCSVCVWKDM